MTGTKIKATSKASLKRSSNSSNSSKSNNIRVKRPYVKKDKNLIYTPKNDKMKNLKFIKLPECIQSILTTSYYRLDTMGGGDCLYHAVLGCITEINPYFSKYLTVNEDKKLLFVYNFKKMLYNDVLNYPYKYKEELTMVPNLPDRLLTMGTWAGEYEVLAITKYLNLNIFVFQTLMNNDGTIKYCTSYCLSNYYIPLDITKNTIFIFNINNTHYETILRFNEESIKGSFKPTEAIVKKVNKVYISQCSV